MSIQMQILPSVLVEVAHAGLLHFGCEDRAALGFGPPIEWVNLGQPRAIGPQAIVSETCFVSSS